VPLPDASEAAAAAVEQIGDELDAAVIAYLSVGDPLPSVTAVIDRLRVLVTEALTAAYRETWPNLPRGLVARTVDEIVDMLDGVIAETLHLATLGRRSARRLTVPDDMIPEADTDAGLLRLAEGFGLWAALGALLTFRRRRRERVRLERDLLARMAATAGDPLPIRLGPHMRMIVRTEVAARRNGFAADVADDNGWVILVRDGRLGPTDHACERVDGRYATTRWMRAHPTQHPNCTRQGVPTRLPAGATVTLLE
jgi:hypothetical protein